MDCDAHMSEDKVKDPKNGFEDYALDQQWAKLQKRDNWFGFKEDLSKHDQIIFYCVISKTKKETGL